MPPDGDGPVRRLIATLPALEVPRPDWPEEAVVVGPLHIEPTDAVLDVPPGEGPLIMELARRAGKDRIRVAEPCNSPLDAVECESCAKGSHCEPGQPFPVPDDGFCMREGNYTSFYKCGGG